MLLSLVITSALAVPPAGFAPCADQSRYYFMLFAGQGVPFRHRTAHTWATWVKATPTADGRVLLEPLTISWLPAAVEVHPQRLRPEPGMNYTLDETFAIMASHNARVSVWGPYEIDAHRYEQARQQIAYLESGQVVYRSIDSFNANDNVINCVHAVTHASPVVRNRVQPVIRVGEPGTSRLAAMYRRGGAWPGYPEKHDWVLQAVVGDKYPVIQREPGEYIPRRWQ
jgi:hypothetical protein